MSARRSWLPRLGLAVALVAAPVDTACVKPGLVLCPDGRSCANGEVCDTAHDSCVDPDQISNCAGSADGTDCTWSTGIGKCFSDVCLTPGCGNGVVEPGEQCDDGNRVSGDGCNADCTSTEKCGNGFVDIPEGEQCDDGNLMSRDGCDSACQNETPTWSYVGIQPLHGLAGNGAFDENARQFVYFVDGLTWVWDEQVWTLAATTTPSATPSHIAVVYDSDRQVVVLIGASTVVDTVWEWSSTGWTARTTTTPPADVSPVPVAAYDRSAKAIVVLAGTHIYQWDGGTGAWALETNLLTSPPTAGAAIAYDQAADDNVLVVGSPTTAAAPSTYIGHGSVWIPQTSGVPDTEAAPTLVYDGTRGDVVALGGAGASGIAYSSAISEWDAGTSSWGSAEVPLPFARTAIAGFYDPSTLNLYAFGGTDGSGTYADLVFNSVTAPTSWQAVPLTAPPSEPAKLATIDSKRGLLVVVQGDPSATTTPAQLWTWSGSAWTESAATPPPMPGSGGALTYDPIRDAVVLLGDKNAGGSDDTWLYSNDTWAPLGSGIAGGAYDVTFDPRTAELTAISGGEAGGVWMLPSTGSAWSLNANTQLPFASGSVDPLPTAVAFAFDAKNSTLLAVENVHGQAFTFDATGSGSAGSGSDAGSSVGWTSTLSPGDSSYSLTADPRRGAVDFVNPTSFLWERDGTSWNQFPAEALTSIGSPHYEPASGRLLIDAVANTSSRVLLIREMTSALPSETCMTGVDADHDGLADCADPDCFWTCTPACPPYTTCM